MRILIVEDDDMIGESVVAGLESEDYAVDWVRDGNSALIALKTTPFSLVVLDLGLPGKDGLKVLQEMRARRMSTPVLVTTARDTVEDRIKGLDAGADDYLIKPYDLDELSARVRALLRRSAGRAEPLIVRGDLVIAPDTRKVTYRGKDVILSSKEYALLVALAEREGVVWSRTQLEEKLYNWDNTVGSNAIEVHIHHLRKKLSDGAIKTVRGVGYLLET
ncbi:MAG: response regulator [Sutterella parvirubra]|uniref:Transcriptional regulatory protein QseB n=1 Tax=Sutterella parvirubra YIT 11816 TaxID=762967 RepID=H3KE21_9BURK|nr:response regulator [Sutterella parvirubra]EHY31641.1 transcriptional regulatory protein QseB [Sutterella parvirubra YIT 11816]MCI7709784.1 response regulator [Sutterella parvirubra]MDR3770831.1 response regulator [Sutterella sp.]MDY5201261.1 response regulator [Sutterella parvirubra]